MKKRANHYKWLPNNLSVHGEWILNLFLENIRVLYILHVYFISFSLPSLVFFFLHNQFYHKFYTLQFDASKRVAMIFKFLSQKKKRILNFVEIFFFFFFLHGWFSFLKYACERDGGRFEPLLVQATRSIFYSSLFTEKKKKTTIPRDKHLSVELLKNWIVFHSFQRESIHIKRWKRVSEKGRTLLYTFLAEMWLHACTCSEGLSEGFIPLRKGNRKMYLFLWLKRFFFS